MACTWHAGSITNMTDLGNDQFQVTFELCQGESNGSQSQTTGFLLDIQCATIDNLLTPSITSTNGVTLNAVINGTTIEWGDIDDPTAPVFIDQTVNGGAQQCFTIDVIVTLDFNCSTNDNLVTFDFVGSIGTTFTSVYPGNGEMHCWSSNSYILPCTTSNELSLTLYQQNFPNFFGSANDSLEIIDEQGNQVAFYDGQTLYDLAASSGFTTINLYPFCFECGNYTINYYAPLTYPDGSIVNPKWLELDFDGNITISDTAHVISILFDSGIPCSGVSSTNPSCPETCDGTIQITDTLLVDPVLYSIDGGTTTQSDSLFENLCVGTYYVNVQDANGYSVIDTVYLISNVPDVDIGPDSSLCDGSTVIIDPGSGFASYLWNDATTNQTLNATSSGDYWVTVTDTNGCISTDSITLGLDEVTALLTNIVNESCNNANNGGATIQNVNGTNIGQFTVTWSDPSGNLFDTDVVNAGGSSSQNALFSGPWQVTIDDMFGCQWNTTVPIQIGSINISTNLGHPQCYATSTGSITAFSTTPGSFSFEIKDANGVIKNNLNTNTANSLTAGIYTVSITDASGCFNEVTVELIDPLELALNLNITPPSCYGDSTGIVYVADVYNYQGDVDNIQYIWDPSGVNGVDLTFIDKQPSGEYNLTIQDEIGCTYQESFFITTPDPLIGNLEVLSKTYCRTKDFQSGNGLVAVESGGLGFSGTGNIVYTWKNLSNGDVSNNTTFVVREPGWMVTTLTDANHCVFTDSIYVDSLNPIAAFTPVSDQFEGPGEFEGTEDMTVKFINESINFSQVDNPLTDSVFLWSLYENNPAGPNWFFSYDYNEAIDTLYRGEIKYEVCLIAKNFNDCKNEICKTIIVHDIPKLIVPNVFTPGASPNAEFYFPSEGINGEDSEAFDCSVFNRYGVEVFHYFSINDRWNGDNMRNNSPCKDGEYFYTYSAKSTNGTLFTGQGSVALIRN